MMTNHYRRPVSEGGTRKLRNISRVHNKKHKAYHLLFATWNPFQIAAELNRVWIDLDFELVVRRKGHLLPKTRNRYLEES